MIDILLFIGSLGLPELFIIFCVVLLLFGAKKIPELAKSLGKATGEFKKAKNVFHDAIEEVDQVEEKEASIQPPKEDIVEASIKETAKKTTQAKTPRKTTKATKTKEKVKK